MPPILGGVKTAGANEFWGKAHFEGDSVVTGARTEILARGPVFITIKITFDIAADGPTEAAKPIGGEPNAADINLGKTSAAPTPKTPHYAATLRFVMGDPWVEIDESYFMPRPGSYVWEIKDGLKPNTVFWVPWFGHGGFNPIGQMKYAPLQPQEKQGGRPFVMLRPRWNQQPGGGMDFFVTRGGARAGRDTPAGPNYDAAAPSVGVVAIAPSRWENPYAQTISAFAENGDTARLRFPVGQGRRAYAVVCGPRGEFDSTGALDFLVRRRVDWTLDKQLRYVLDWERKPELAGPRILITRDELERLQSDYKANRDTPEMRVLREFIAERDKLKGRDLELLKLIIGEPVKPPQLPSPDLFIQRRYQDDFLNPTQRATRSADDNLALADLFSGGKPMGGAWQAAFGYIFSDPDHWPGYMNGWGPGNPNFHTDKYMVAAFAGAALRDHPDSPKWLAYAKENFSDDTRRVFLQPDGAGFECPGYSGYSLGLQLELATLFKNTGAGNPVAENELFKKNATWHRHLLTPFDARLGLRHEAPIGDTHRWTSGGVSHFGKLAKFYKESDPAFAGELMGVWQSLRATGQRGSLLEDLIHTDSSIPATTLEKMGWGSGHFYGFGGIFRSQFGTPRETFATFKAGPAQGHYHNDELSFHFYGAGTPLSLDYNCSYHPRGDHAALHNTMTFGTARPVKAPGDAKESPAQEQLFGTAKVGVFKTTSAADILVAERTGDELTLSPIYPEDTRFGFGYPTRKTPVPITHRRFFIFVKHAPGSKLNDYLVIRDETRGADKGQINVHLLARDLKQEGNLWRGTGQWDTDALLYFAAPEVPQGELSQWYYFDEWMSGPGQYGDKNSEANKTWAKKIEETRGEARIPPVGYKGEWKVGEYQKWLKIPLVPNAAMTWILYPQKQGEAAPQFETIENGVRVKLGAQSEEITLSSQGAFIVQNGQRTELAKELPALGQM
jgi:hypothetical protein